MARRHTRRRPSRRRSGPVHDATAAPLGEPRLLRRGFGAVHPHVDCGELSRPCPARRSGPRTPGMSGSSRWNRSVASLLKRVLKPARADVAASERASVRATPGRDSRSRRHQTTKKPRNIPRNTHSIHIFSSNLSTRQRCLRLDDARRLDPVVIQRGCGWRRASVRTVLELERSAECRPVGLIPGSRSLACLRVSACVGRDSCAARAAERLRSQPAR